MAFHVRLALLKPSFKREMGRYTVSLPQGGNGDSRRTGEGTHLAKAGIEAHFWKGKTAYNVKSTPVSVQITMNSTEFD